MHLLILGLLMLLAAPAPAQVYTPANWQGTETVSITGDWQLYWGVVALPTELHRLPAPTAAGPLPGSWTQYTHKGEPLPTHGCATYVLRLHLPGNNEEGKFSLYLPFIWTAHHLHVNGRLMSSSGRVACSADGAESQMLRSQVPLPAVDTITLVLHVSDHYLFGGDTGEWRVGPTDQLHTELQVLNMLNLLAMGGLLMMAVYFLMIYLFRRKEKAMPLFGMLALLLALRFAVFGDHYIYEWLNTHFVFFSFVVQLKVYYITTILLGGFGVRYVQALFPADGWPRLGKVLIWAAYSAALVLLLVPGSVVPYVLPLGVVVPGVGGLYVLAVLVRAFVQKRDHTRLLMAGLGMVLLAGLHDGLQLANIFLLSHHELLTYGFVGFLFLQSVILSRRYATAFNEVEDLSQNLERKVEQRTLELQDANEEVRAKNESLSEAYHIIEAKNQDITDSIHYARRIQLSILPQLHILQRHYPQSNLFYQPKDIVSGDFYWFAESGPYLYVCVADCTGHGVPGAFMSVMGSNLLTRIVQESPVGIDPGEVLDRLHLLVRDALHQDQTGTSQDGMDLALLRLQPGTAQVAYSGANRPLLLLANGELQEYTPTKRAIGGKSLGPDDMTNLRYVTQHLQPEPGSRLFLFTDGVTDQFGGPQKRKFTGKRLKELLVAYQTMDLPLAIRQIQDQMDQWKEETAQTDDILLLGITLI